MSAVEPQDAAAPMPNSWAMFRTLVGVAALSGILIVLVYQWTLPIIKANRAAALHAAVFRVLPGTKSVGVFRLTGDGKLEPLQGEDERAVKYYAGYDADGKLLGVAIEAEGQGFQDVIKVLYGYSPEKQAIVGLKVLDSKETPGLGDKIGHDPDFLANFKNLAAQMATDGKKLEHPFEVVKKGVADKPWRIHAITGATISSNAVGKLLNRNVPVRLPAVLNNVARLKQQPPQSPGAHP